MRRLGQCRANLEPGVGGVNFLEGKIGVEQFADDFFSFDHKKSEFFAVLFFAKRTETLNLCLGEHG